MTPRQLTLARQALGLPRTDHSYPRNYFVVKIGSDDEFEWISMAYAGLATRKACATRMYSWVYRLTEAGIAAAREDAHA